MCDLVFYNAKVITMDPAQPAASLVAIKGNRIVAVSIDEQLEKLRKRETRIVDCAGDTLIPGFIDAHCHINAYAEALVSLNLSPREHIHSISDIQNRIRACCELRPAGTWVRGKGYNEFYIAEKRHPNRWDLDVAAPLHPVKLTHRSGHAHVLNSLALAQTGITEETGDPPEGMIDREPETGMPTGILYSMGEYLSDKIPLVEEAEMDRGLGLADKKLLSCGITSVQDASSVNDLHRWKRFEFWKARNLFQPRLRMMMCVRALGELQQKSFVSGLDRADLRQGGVKIIVSRVTGEMHPGQEELNEQISAIHEAGLQAVVHAIEEPEIEAACNAVAYALSRRSRPDHRHRIEHCSVCTPRLMKKIAGLGIVVVTQPSFIYYSGDRYLKTVSEDQREHLYPIGSMFGNGVRIGFGSDFPVSDPNPMLGIHAAVTRMTENGNRVLPDQGIRVLDALRFYTLGAAAAGFEEDIKGSITPGKLADLVLLSEDPCTIDAEHIRDIRVRITVLDGRVVWSDDAFSF